jgi:hypothetical protein
MFQSLAKQRQDKFYREVKQQTQGRTSSVSDSKTKTRPISSKIKK